MRRAMRINASSLWLRDGLYSEWENVILLLIEKEEKTVVIEDNRRLLRFDRND